LNKALTLINPDPQPGQRYSGSGWLQERYLDQVSSLVEVSHRSARQALGYSDLSDQPHRKRPHDETLPSHDESSSSAPVTDPFPSKRCANVTNALCNHDSKPLSNFHKTIPDDPPRLPTHPSHEVTSLNPSLKPYQILALTRDQPNLDLQQQQQQQQQQQPQPQQQHHYFSQRGGGGGNGKGGADSVQRSNSSNDSNSLEAHSSKSGTLPNSLTY
jgi:hypothetical protein